jgi:glycosyltransferase involved in cell wall biosynthesis
MVVPDTFRFMTSVSCPPPWLVFQIGAREHYAIARALRARGVPGALVTDFWLPPGCRLGGLPGAGRLRDRYHADLADARVCAFNTRFLFFELSRRFGGRCGWPVVVARNRLFQKQALRALEGIRGELDAGAVPTVFSYSYAALELFRHARRLGWRTVLGQIDPGPEEERIVAAEHRRYPEMRSGWQPAPAGYWDSWREETGLADRIIVNSGWSRQCLLKEGVPEEKLEVVPLVYQPAGADGGGTVRPRKPGPFRVLFLGQIILRKGIARLLEAMRLLVDEEVELILAGPSEIDPAAWRDAPNVRWIGPLRRGAVGTFYQDADVFILPTLSDGYALTQLEALGHGLPVIASRHCGAAVTHGGNGWILDALEPAGIAAAIRTAMAGGLADVKPPAFTLDDLARRLCG